ncbi:hypothetical protein [Kribbella qitaiheensis]|uniref:hypothetical protein n=1 Tax=Kribbella qitaiheensis TaxID=1544730 RepID=UPI00162541DB|nr:hypothetical protein [Kribbella qitaiheensis]
MTDHPGEEFVGEEPLVDDLVDETRRPEDVPHSEQPADDQPDPLIAPEQPN